MTIKKFSSVMRYGEITADDQEATDALNKFIQESMQSHGEEVIRFLLEQKKPVSVYTIEKYGYEDFQNYHAFMSYFGTEEELNITFGFAPLVIKRNRRAK